MKVFVVNELCEVDVTYNNCHGVFSDLDKAKKKAHEVFKAAKESLHVEVDSEVFPLVAENDDYAITVDIDIVEMEEPKNDTYYVLNIHDLEQVLENCFTDEERRLICSHYSLEEILEILKCNMNIDWQEYTTIAIQCFILDKIKKGDI